MKCWWWFPLEEERGLWSPWGTWWGLNCAEGLLYNNSSSLLLVLSLVPIDVFYFIMFYKMRLYPRGQLQWLPPLGGRASKCSFHCAARWLGCFPSKLAETWMTRKLRKDAVAPQAKSNIGKARRFQGVLLLTPQPLSQLLHVLPLSEVLPLMYVCVFGEGRVTMVTLLSNISALQPLRLLQRPSWDRHVFFPCQGADIYPSPLSLGDTK